jgi:uncharacterized protein
VKKMFKIKIRQLDNEGDFLDGSVSAESIALEVADPAIDLTFGDDVEYSLHASSVSGGVLITGQIGVDVHAECGRCLCRYKFRLVLDDICHFYEEVSGDDLDISNDIREDLLIALPTKYLCSETCKGLCTLCGKNLNNEECGCQQDSDFDDEVNPWSALDNLKV